MNLLVRPAAAADLEEAFAWYEAPRAGLGEEFLRAVGPNFGALLERPRAYPVLHRDTRRAHLHRFPYSIYYKILGDHVVVVACFHARRDPRLWRRRR